MNIRAWLQSACGRFAGLARAQVVFETSLHELPQRRRERPRPGAGSSFTANRFRLRDGSVALADENYLRESIVHPAAKVVAGFEPIMPTFEGLLSEEEIIALIAFIKDACSRAKRRRASNPIHLLCESTISNENHSRRRRTRRS